MRGAAREVALAFHASMGRLTPEQAESEGFGRLYAACVRLSVALIEEEKTRGDVCPECDLPR